MSCPSAFSRLAGIDELNTEMIIALLISGPLILVGLASCWFQIRGLGVLRARRIVPSDEASYLRNRYRRRMMVGVLMMVIGVMIGGAYVSGMVARADELGKPQPTDADGVKKQMTEEQKEFLKRFGYFWISVAILTLVMIGLAVVDGLSSRRYWLKLYREMRDEHNSQLRRDIAVYKQQKEQGRGGGAGGGSYGGRLGTGPESDN